MGGILETFYIMFASNADELEKGANDAMGTVDKLEESIASANKGTQALGMGLVRMAAQATAAIGAVVGFGALVNGVFASAQMANGLHDLSKAIGVSVEDLSVWGDAVAKSGGSAAEFQADIRGIAQDMAQIQVTGKSRLLPFFNELGVSVVDSAGKVRKAMDILPQLADAFEQMAPEQAIGIGQKLGLSQGTIMLLQQGRREVDAVIARQKELGVVTTQQAEIAAKYNKSVEETSHLYRTLTMEIGAGILPAVTWFLERVQSLVMFLREHKDLAVGFFIAIGAAIMTYAVPAFVALAVASLPVWGPIALAVGTVAALAAGFALLYEDVMVFIKGGDSLIGRMADWLNSFELVRAAIEGISKAFNYLKGLNDSWNEWSGNSEPITLESLRKAQVEISNAQATPLAATTSGAIMTGSPRMNSRTTTVQIGEVNVQTQATDAEGMAGAAAGALSQQMRQAQSNFDDGVQA